ncbi:hypothetical protein AWB74_06231 [Caballeronia arvi]|uniref:Lipoprotein n=1 Tax=Caballeronia arvi TaxID=1777135 RepID=A0A158KNK5_9BURK|nr:hypothetical protein [Caballeronia arvi]SAL82329.1 hypothetical protein AWB74_06231 [Caballeronia arvi]
MKFPCALALCAAVALAGCANSRKPAPEPDMSQLVPVNKSMPSEVVGKAVLPVRAPVQQSKTRDAK